MDIFIGESGMVLNLKMAMYLFIDHPETDWQLNVQWGMSPFPMTLIAKFANEDDARAAAIRIASDDYVTFGDLDGTV
jgi:hypothetical protein